MPSGHTTLRLVNVLQVPSFPCDFFSGNCVSDYRLISQFSKATVKGCIIDKQGVKVEHVQTPSGECLYPQIKLREPTFGPRVGPSLLNTNISFVVCAAWSSEERGGWKSLKLLQAEAGDLKRGMDATDPGVDESNRTMNKKPRLNLPKTSSGVARHRSRTIRPSQMGYHPPYSDPYARRRQVEVGDSKPGVDAPTPQI